ncbi:MAG: heme-binding protein [Pirellulales bacterium]
MARINSIWGFALAVLSAGLVLAEMPAATDEPDPSGKVVARVQGDAPLEPRPQDDGTTFYSSGIHRVTTPLPVGYPPPTPPGAIEIKSYPRVRRATVSGTGQGPDGMRNSAAGFWPLFAHIKRRGIAMTAPVEIEYQGLEVDDGDSAAEAETGGDGDRSARTWSMSFLYRTADAGPAESYAGIEVADTEPLTVFAVGLAGDATREAIDAALGQLNQAVRASRHWQQQGPPRIMGYNGPDVPEPERWSEVQVPVVEVAESDER